MNASIKKNIINMVINTKKTGGNEMKKPLIVYYSWSCGNTERIAKSLQSVTGGDHLETPESKINAWAQSVKVLL